MNLIDKDAIVAEIGRRKEINKYRDTPDGLFEDEAILFFINTLEVKEVDLEKEFNNFLDDVEGVPRMWHSDEQIEWGKDIAKHFFELGIKASNVLTWEDMKQIRDIMVECSAIGLWSKPDEEYYQEVVKRFKAHKGE